MNITKKEIEIDEELNLIKKRAKEKDVKVETLIRNMSLNSITSESLLTNEKELRNFIIKVVEERIEKRDKQNIIRKKSGNNFDINKYNEPNYSKIDLRAFLKKLNKRIINVNMYYTS